MGLKVKCERNWYLGVYYSIIIIIVIIITLVFITITVISIVPIAKGFLRHGFIHSAPFTVRHMDHNEKEKPFR